MEGTEVVNNRELIIISFIDADIADYRKVAFVMLTSLVTSITIFDIILARPLSFPPLPREQSNQPSSRIAVLLSSASLVSKVLLARSDKIRISTDDLDISLLGSGLSRREVHGLSERGDKVHVFESLSYLQVIRNVSRSTALRSLQPDALRATEANVPHTETQILQ